MQQQQDEYMSHASLDDGALFDQYGHTIFAYLRLHTSRREDAEDLTLEVFTAALENDNLAALPHGERLAWLRRVAHNKLVDSYRHAARHPVVALDKLQDALYDDERREPEQIALQREVYAQLHRVIEQLSDTQQHMLRLRYGDGLLCSEIATLLQKREDAVRKQLSRTLSQLRTLYRKQEEGETHARPQ